MRLSPIFQVAWQTVKHLKKLLQMLAVRLSAGWMLILLTVVQYQCQVSQMHPANLCNAFTVVFIHAFNIRQRQRQRE